MITARQAATKLGVGIRFVNSLIRRKKLRAEKKEGRYVIDEKSLRDYVANRPKPGRPAKI